MKFLDKKKLHIILGSRIAILFVFSKLNGNQRRGYRRDSRIDNTGYPRTTGASTYLSKNS